MLLSDNSDGQGTTLLPTAAGVTPIQDLYAPLGANGGFLNATGLDAPTVARRSALNVAR